MATTPRTNPERITALEVEVKFLREAFTTELGELRDANKILSDTIKAQNEKLDSLLELRAKGMGAIWLASAILGSGILGGLYFLTSWLRGDM
jgi:hypothetical protein